MVEQRAIAGEQRMVETVELVRMIQMLGAAEVLQAVQAVRRVMRGVAGEVWIGWRMMIQTIHIMTQLIEAIQVVLERTVAFDGPVHVQVLAVRFRLVAGQQAVDAVQLVVQIAVQIAVEFTVQVTVQVAVQITIQIRIAVAEHVRIVQSSDHVRRAVALAGVAQIAAAVLAVGAVAGDRAADADVRGYLVTSIVRLLQIACGRRLARAAGRAAEQGVHLTIAAFDQRFGDQFLVQELFLLSAVLGRFQQLAGRVQMTRILADRQRRIRNG